MDDQVEGAPDPRETVRLLLRAGERLPGDAHRRILTLGPAAIPSLIELLEDAALAGADAPGQGYAPVHAAELLGALGAAEAVEPMLHALARTDTLDLLHDRVIPALRAMGRAVVEPALRAHDASADLEFRGSVRSVLAAAGVKDERIFDLLVDALAEDLTLGAANLAEYGDPRALEPLSRALDEYKVASEEGAFADQDLFEVDAAIEELGGTLTPSQAEKVRRASARADAYRDALRAAVGREGVFPEPARRPEQPGRNDPCWCGSGAKYKKCHLREDEKEAC